MSVVSLSEVVVFSLTHFVTWVWNWGFSDCSGSSTGVGVLSVGEPSSVSFGVVCGPISTTSGGGGPGSGTGGGGVPALSVGGAFVTESKYDGQMVITHITIKIFKISHVVVVGVVWKVMSLGYSELVGVVLLPRVRLQW